MQPLLLALRFLTVLPWPGRLSDPPTPATFGRSVALFPLAGLLLGAIAAAIDLAARQLWPPTVAGAFVLATLIVLTGALHLDGFLDTCDGLFLWHPEKRLDVMRDSRVGGYAVAGGIALYGIKLTSLGFAAGDARLAALILTPVLGRLALSVALALFPYARPSGVGNAFKEGTCPRHLLVAVVIAVLAALWFGVAGTIALLLALATAWLLARSISGRLGGLTGDTYGFISECVEAVTLITITAAPLADLVGTDMWPGSGSP